jgi:hypothetical protein
MSVKKEPYEREANRILIVSNEALARRALKIITVVAAIAIGTLISYARAGEAQPQMTFAADAADPKNLVAHGPIGLETPTIFVALMASIRRIRGTSDGAVIELDSPGGSLVGGMVLGRAIRAYGFQTNVGEGQVCASACVLAFMGGVSRYVSGDGKLGVHQFASLPAIEHPDMQQFTGKDVVVEQDLVGQLLDYAKEMGVSADVIAIASRTPPSDIHWLTREEITSTNCAEVIGNPPRRPIISSPGPPANSGSSSPSATPHGGNAALPGAARAAMLIASPDNPQKPVVNLGSTVWSTIPPAPGQPATVAVKADADIPDLKMHATMILRKNTDPTLQATHTIDLKFAFADGAPIAGFKDVGAPQMRKIDSTASEALTSVKVKISDVYFLLALVSGHKETVRNLNLMQSWLRSSEQFPRFDKCRSAGFEVLRAA